MIKIFVIYNEQQFLTCIRNKIKKTLRNLQKNVVQYLQLQKIGCSASKVISDYFTNTLSGKPDERYFAVPYIILLN